MIDNNKNELFPSYSPITYVISLVSLFIFGIVFNHFTGWLIKSGRERGNTWILVVIGCIISIYPTHWFIGRPNMWRVYWLFGASGIPMIVGAIYRAIISDKEVEHADKKLLKITTKILNDAKVL